MEGFDLSRSIFVGAKEISIQEDRFLLNAEQNQFHQRMLLEAEEEEFQQKEKDQLCTLDVKAEQLQDDLVDRLPPIAKTQGAIAVAKG